MNHFRYISFGYLDLFMQGAFLATCISIPFKASCLFGERSFKISTLGIGSCSK